ncbi:MAG: S41 family peptidase [Rhodothermales bacterium]
MRRPSVRILAPAVVAAALVLMAVRSGDDDLFELRRNFEIFGSVYEQLVLGYVDDIRPQPFMRAGIEAMLAELDPYTVFYDEADLADSRVQMQQSTGTVGLTLGERAGRLTVFEPGSNAEAYRQGVRIGDVIVGIGGVDAATLTLSEAYDLLSGEPGSTVEVVIQRTGEDLPRTFTLPRVPVDRDNVRWAGYLGPDTTALYGYVKLDQFGPRSGREVRRAFREMARGAGLNGLVLDLRNNPGGVLEDAVEIVGLFVPKDSPVVTLRSRDRTADTVHRTDTDPLFPDLPVVVLINEYSASASEIVAGALQDYDRAVVLGTTTFGKGLVQVVHRLPHNAALKMTIAHYVLPSGRSIHSAELNTASSRVAVPEERLFQTPEGRTVRSGVGVEPDIPMERPFVSELETALRENGAFFLFADHQAATQCATLDFDACVANQDRLLAEFRSWLADRQFSYLTLSEKQLALLDEEMREAGWDATAGALSDVERRLRTEKEGDFDRYAERLTGLIAEELRVRMLSGQAALERSLTDDAWVSRARELLDRPAERGRLLGQ